MKSQSNSFSAWPSANIRCLNDYLIIKPSRKRDNPPPPQKKKTPKKQKCTFKNIGQVILKGDQQNK